MIGQYLIYEPTFSLFFLFIPRENIRQSYGLLMFSEGIKWKKLGRMGYYTMLCKSDVGRYFTNLIIISPVFRC